ncbi:N-acetylneuraminate synthase family protein [Oceanibaculum pacificum]|uniref:Polyhydroxyalkanoate biosynthesis repressor PhaR n=1 Tax=Oceanibaculum pacificum TaxID=580166 RepID=A0A154WF96_9PROT|nr:N-acetylneuraminate synthase family protein [Oceanibaculum pacificum]KZD12190.1 polyhydroxyalkanoate biosynthesis repressor PhaR [Oceanibaculum pacificum]
MSGAGNSFLIGNRRIGGDAPPLVIAEIGINHEGSEEKAAQMIDAAAASGCECVKFQTHVIDDEMIPNDVVPANASESIWDIMERCVLSAEAEARLKARAEAHGMIFLSTPFSRAAAEQLDRLGVDAYKIGSGECNNYPLVAHIARKGKPVILSTGMNDIASIARSVALLRDAGVPYALLHCTSIYPTPYEAVRLGAIAELQAAFPDAVVGLSDHTLTNYTCLGAVALGAGILERHFTADKSWPGPDIAVSMDPKDLRDLVEGSRAIHLARGGRKDILPAEQPTIDFAYASVVSIAPIKAGEELTMANIWVKRPGTGPILAGQFDALLGRRAATDIAKDCQLSPEMLA